MNSFISAILLAACLVVGAAQAQDKKSPVPGKPEINRVTKQIRGIFKAQYAKKDRSVRIDLAKQLLQEAAKLKEDLTQLYVVLTEASNLATEGFDIELTFQITSTIADKFDLTSANPPSSLLSMKVQALKKLRRTAKGPEDFRDVAQACLDVAREAVGAKNFGAAGDAAREASAVARLARSRELSSEASALSKEITDIKRRLGELGQAEATLKTKPGDARANLTVGLHHCLDEGDWERGIPHLAKGSDEGLRKLAKMELLDIKAATAQGSLGNAWYDLAEKENNPLRKAQYQNRARYWYERAGGEATGVLALKIKNRLETLARIPTISGTKKPGRKGTAFSAGGSLAKGLVGYWRFDESTTATREPPTATR